MPNKKKVLFLLGSTKAHSVNKQIIEYIKHQLEIDFDAEIYKSIDQLPYFNPDIDTDDVPESVSHFRRAIEKADGVIICTPEYVFSLPGILKNAIEWLVSTTIYTNKPTALITASSSGAKAHESLNLVMKTIGAVIGEHSSILISGVKSKMNAQGEIKDANTQRMINELITNFKEKMN